MLGSLGSSLDLRLHPWDYLYISGHSDAELINIYGQIDRELRNGRPGLFLSNNLRNTQARIRRILEQRGISTTNMSLGFTLGSVSTLQDLSPGFIIGQPIQQGVVNIPAPQPNITFQTIPAPQPAALLPTPELPKRIRVRDQWGNIVEEHDETEQEKNDREYEEWKEKFGAK